MPPRRAAAKAAASPRTKSPAAPVASSSSASKRTKSPASGGKGSGAAAAAARGSSPVRRLSPSPSPSRASGPRQYQQRPVHHLNALSDEDEHEDEARDVETEDELDLHRSEAAMAAKKQQQQQHARRRAPHSDDDGSGDEHDDDGASHASGASRKSHSDRKRRGSAAASSARTPNRSPRTSPVHSPESARPSQSPEAFTLDEGKRATTTLTRKRSGAAATAAASATRQAKAQPSKPGFCRRLCSRVFWTLSTLTLIGFFVAGLLFLDDWNLAQRASRATNGGPDGVASLTEHLVARHPAARHALVDVLEPALRHHVDSFAAMTSSEASHAHHDGAADASEEWLSGGLAVLQAPKPLVLVLAVDSSSSGGERSDVVARTFVTDLLRALWRSEDGGVGSEQLLAEQVDAHLLDLGEEALARKQLKKQKKLKSVSAGWVREQLKRFFARTKSNVLSSALETLQAQAHQLLPGLVPSPSVVVGSGRTPSLESLRASLKRGVVLAPLSVVGNNNGGSATNDGGDAGRLSRAAAEAFHQYADDVAAPVREAAFVFVVDVAGSNGAGGAGSADDAVRRTLEASWANGAQEEEAEVARDEVLRPLLSRIVRNVIDLTRL